MVASSLTPSAIDKAEAFWHGSSGLSARNVLNIGFLFDNSYPFNDHTKADASGWSPSGSGFTTGTPFPALIDSNGWPNNASASGQTWGVAFNIPNQAQFAGPYTVDFVGNGNFTIFLQQSSGTWTVVGTPSNCTATPSGSNLVVASTAGSGSGSFQFTYTCTTADPQIVQLVVNATGASGFFLKNIRFYRTAEQADLLAGKIFRTAYLQSIVNLNPSAVRPLNWLAGSNDHEYRFENRALPTSASWGTVSNWPVSPVYSSTVTGTNVYAVSAAPTTPVSLTHGEIAALRFTNGSVRGGFFNVTGITNATTAVVEALQGTFTGNTNGTTTITVASIPLSLGVGRRISGTNIPANTTIVTWGTTTITISNAATGTATGTTFSVGHTLNTGDLMIMQNLNQMTLLNYFPVTVTVTDATHFSIGVNTSNTTNYPPFVSGGVGTIYLTIDVGARGAKPISTADGGGPISFFGDFIGANQYNSLTYDKNISITSDGAGNRVTGAWTLVPGESAPFATTPIEVMAKFANELNALSVSQGGTTPINLWYCLPYSALTSMDPDYLTASDYALGAIDVLCNPSSAKRTVGWSALSSGIKLFLEYNNETWNTAGGILGTQWLAFMGSLRWPTSGTADYIDMYALRSTLIMRGVKATSVASRIICTLGGQGIVGFNSTSLNFLRCFGSSVPGQGGNFYTTDSLSSGWGTPISNHDTFNTASYLDAGATYYNGQFNTDSANYAGGNPTVMAAAIASFVSEVTNNPANDGQSINLFLTLTASYASAMRAIGKTAINYEGGPDWPTAVGSRNAAGNTLTIADNAFLTAVLDSSQWATAQVGYFNSYCANASAAMPSVYTYVGSQQSGSPLGNQRWAYCQPDSYGGTTTEGQGLLNSPVWVAMSSRNQALSL